MLAVSRQLVDRQLALIVRESRSARRRCGFANGTETTFGIKWNPSTTLKPEPRNKSRRLDCVDDFRRCLNFDAADWEVFDLLSDARLGTDDLATDMPSRRKSKCR